MRIAVRKVGATKAVVGAHFHIGGTSKAVERAWLRKDGSLHKLFGSYSVTLSSYVDAGHGNSAGPITVTSGGVSAIVDGSIGTISYAWTRTAPDGHSWTINSPTAAATTFSTTADENESWDATFICTATDQAGQVLASSPVSVACSNIYYGGGYRGGGGGLPYP
jgi:hypothetical protein